MRNSQGRCDITLHYREMRDGECGVYPIGVQGLYRWKEHSPKKWCRMWACATALLTLSGGEGRLPEPLFRSLKDMTPVEESHRMGEPLGIHVLMELSGCDGDFIDQPEPLEKILYEAVESVQMQPLQQVHHHYQPQGVSIVILVAESHIAIHTWPEHGYVAVDFFSCRTDIEVSKVEGVFQRRLHPERIQTQVIRRGPEGID